MDGALSSDRHNPNHPHVGGGGGGGGNYHRGGGGNYHHHRGGGGGGGRGGRGRGGGYRHGGGGGQGGRHHTYRRDGGGDRRDGDHHRDRVGSGGGYRGGGGKYHGGGGGGRERGGGGGGPRQPANRFSTETRSVDPHRAMMRQLTAMVAKMGDLGGAAEVASATATTGDDDEDEEEEEDDDDDDEVVIAGAGGGGGAGRERRRCAKIRPVVRAIGTNVSDLVEVLCGPNNAPLFLKFGGEDGGVAVVGDAVGDDEGGGRGGGGEGGGGGGGDDVGVGMMMENDASSSSSTAMARGGRGTTTTTIDASVEAGGLATLLLSCSSNLPLQTPSYAALTLGVDVMAPRDTHGGFARRCVVLALRLLGRDIDIMLECGASTTTTASSSSSSSYRDGRDDDDDNDDDRTMMMMSSEERVARMKSNEDRRSVAESYGGAGNGVRIDSYHRAKLLLRYLAHLTTIGIVDVDELVGLLVVLVECASNATTTSTSTSTSGAGDASGGRAMSRAGRLLASLVLSVVPYVMRGVGRRRDDDVRRRLTEIVDAIDGGVVGRGSGYESEYDPGTGATCVLLGGESDDASPPGIAMAGADDEGGEEEDVDDDDNDVGDDDGGGDRPAPCADTLQDLLRTVRKLISSCPSSSATRFALLDDAPWRSLMMNVPTEGEDDMEEERHRPGERTRMRYQGEPLSLDLIGGDECRCRSIPYLLSIDDRGEGDENVEIRCGSLDGIVFGRLAIFDAPPNPDEDGDGEDEEGGEVEEVNQNHESYVNTFSLIDRFFLSDAVRDVLLCHRPMVSEAGADRNTAKEVAEQVWAVSHLFKSPPPLSGAAGMEGDNSALSPNSSQAASRGIEYGIIETLLSLVVQATPTNSSTPSASPLHSHLYISRIILELTKLQPSLVPQAIVLAVSGMFNDFVPSLTPSARENLGNWFGFHLVNTGYQWPRAYWDHWAPYAACVATDASCGRNSRGEFIKVALHSMASMSSEGALSVVKECLPPGSALVQSVLLSNREREEEEISSMERDLINRIWNMGEDPESIRCYLISDEVSESHHSSVSGNSVDNSMHHKSVWWRARLAVRALFHPVQREKFRMARAAQNAWKEQQSRTGDGDGDIVIDGIMDEDVDETEDLLADLSDAVPRFKPVILAALARDADAYDSISSGKLDDDELLLAGEVSILEELGNIIPYWDLTMANALIECLTKCRIVSGMAVAKWALAGDIDTHWWKFVSLAFHNSILDACSSFHAAKTDLGGGIGMIVDDCLRDEDPAETAALRLDEALKSTVPLLKFVTERACQILAACSTDKKVPLACADVADGMKHLLHALIFHFHSLIVLAPSSSGGTSGILTTTNVQKGFASMDADGKKLALLCQRALGSCKGEQGKVLLHGLSLALEKLF